jgi:hypothetical protein
MMDFRDLAIEMYGDENVLLREHIASLQEDVATYREVLLRALDVLSDVTRQRDQLRKRVWQLLDAQREAA